MIVYRVEDSDGNGYRRSHTGGTSLYEHVQNAMLDYELSAMYKPHCQPLPWHDNVPKCFLKRDGWRFGFPCEHGLIRWFSPHDLAVMANHGGVLVSYSVPEKSVWEGVNQCVFFVDHAVEVGRETLSNFTRVSY